MTTVPSFLLWPTWRAPLQQRLGLLQLRVKLRWLDPERRIGLQRCISLSLLQWSVHWAALLRWVGLPSSGGSSSSPAAGASGSSSGRSGSSPAACQPRTPPSPLQRWLRRRSTSSGSGGTPSGGCGCRPPPSPSDGGGVDRAWPSADLASKHFFCFKK
jgi:hypothetical protein